MVLDEAVGLLREIGDSIRERVYNSINRQSIDQKSAIYKVGHDDIIYQVDKDVEDLIISALEKHAEQFNGIILIAEGIGDGEYPVFPNRIEPDQTKYRLIIDPIDGTRGLMYNKRPAFFLAALAPNRGENTSLSDTEAAVMMELPTSKGILADSFSAIKGKGAMAWRTNLSNQKEEPLTFSPSRSESIFGGFAQLCRFFSPGREVIAGIEERIIETLFPDAADGQAFVFEDQYISTGGQFYELLMGHDRFTADIRASLFRKFRRDGKKAGLSCHPYDICATLILQEAGIVIMDLEGNPLDCRLNTVDEVDWAAFANEKIKEEVWPALRESLKHFKII